MYNDFSPIVTGACTAAALMLIEHLTMRWLDFRVRYALGVLAILAGLAAWAWRTNQWESWRAATLIAFGSGAFVLIAYGLRWLWSREIGAAREAGRIEGRTLEANKRATGIARTRDDG